MGFLSSYGNSNAEDKGFEKLPVAKGYKAKVVRTSFDDEKATVDIVFDIFGFGDSPERRKARHFLQKKDGSKNDISINILHRQLKQAGIAAGSTVQQLVDAVPKLDGQYVLLNVSNKKNSDFQDFEIAGVGQREPEELIDAEGSSSDDDLPF